MDDYLSERQQMDWLRSTLKENAPWAVTGVAIFAVGLLGWQQWQAYLDRQAASASQKYESTLDALSKGDRDGAARLVKDLRSDYGRTPYGDLGALALARFHVEGGRLSEAEALLEDVVQHTHDADLAVVARLRLARVERANGKADAALATLAAAPIAQTSPAFADVRGDVLWDKGDKAGAVAAWREALAAKGPGINRELVELKISAADPAPAAAAGQAP
ncbi:MAG: tetratricopeptide repeat protein [Proteobacteria bacterium]|nr:tetratricopeptide repeat protein [Pseudomonadota bacterium]